MSADHATADDDAPDSHDPYGIVPDDFCENWNAETIPQALSNAESAPSTTAPAERPRCPDCLSVDLTPRASHAMTAADSGGGWRCHDCASVVTDALPPLAAARRDAAHAVETDREAVRPRCRGCLSTALYPVPERAPLEVRWGCTACGDTFDEPLPSRRATVRGDLDPPTRTAIREARQQREGIDAADLESITKADVEPIGETEAVTLGEVTDE